MKIGSFVEIKQTAILKKSVSECRPTVFTHRSEMKCDRPEKSVANSH